MATDPDPKPRDRTNTDTDTERDTAPGRRCVRATTTPAAPQARGRGSERASRRTASARDDALIGSAPAAERFGRSALADELGAQGQTLDGVVAAVDLLGVTVVHVSPDWSMCAGDMSDGEHLT